MAHIAMVSIPAPGHVNPSLEIIRELVSRGHRVTYANDPAWADTVRDAGAELVPYHSTLPFHRAGSGEDAWDGDEIDALRLFLDDAIAMLPQLRAAYDADRPDLLLYDIAGGPARSGVSRPSSCRPRTWPGRATRTTCGRPPTR